jgi:hypothetical protein
MDVFRVILSVIIFALSSYLVIDLFINGFNWLVFLACVAGYLLIHFIWPKKQAEESPWYDILELIIDLPYRAVSSLLRGLGKFFRNGDLDLDL